MRNNSTWRRRELTRKRVWRKPTWGTCAGLILLAESANRTKKGGQELIGGIDVRVNRNHFGRQSESFQADLNLEFLRPDAAEKIPVPPFRSVFIRAPVVEKVLPHENGIQVEESHRDDTIVAPSRCPATSAAAEQVKTDVEILARLPTSTSETTSGEATQASAQESEGNIIAVRQGNVFGTSFHPELTGDSRIHRWWLQQVVSAVDKRKFGDSASEKRCKTIGKAP